MKKQSFWNGKRVLVTGHTGFKGSWLALRLAQLGADVYGFSLPPEKCPNLFDSISLSRFVKSQFGDIRDNEKICMLLNECQPEVVFHLAAQSLVRRSYSDPLETYGSNVIGTTNVLDAINRTSSTKVGIIVTTDKVYANRNGYYPFRETDPLGGIDPYSASKAAAEIIVASYREAFLKEKGIAIASVRAGNVVGGGDWAEDRLIPDLIRAWLNKSALELRNPKSMRPWQHVLDPLNGYLVLAEQLVSNPSLAGPFNFGPSLDECISVADLVNRVKSRLTGLQVKSVGADATIYEANTLRLDNSKARHQLGIVPRWNFDQTLERTVNWYKRYYEGEDAINLCLEDLKVYDNQRKSTNGKL